MAGAAVAEVVCTESPYLRTDAALTGRLRTRLRPLAAVGRAIRTRKAFTPAPRWTLLLSGRSWCQAFRAVSGHCVVCGCFGRMAMGGRPALRLRFHAPRAPQPTALRVEQRLRHPPAAPAAGADGAACAGLRGGD